MERLPDWEPRLLEYLESVRDRPHEYGAHDCMTFVGGAVKALTGQDLFSEHIGKYEGELSAARYLKGLGFDSPEAMIDSVLEEKHVGFAQRGDIVLTPEGIPGVGFGDDALVVGVDEGREGLRRIPRELWSKAWAV